MCVRTTFPPESLPGSDVTGKRAHNLVADTLANYAALVMRTRTQLDKRSFSIYGPSIWNKIPPHIRNLHSAAAFCKALETYLFLQL